VQRDRSRAEGGGVDDLMHRLLRVHFLWTVRLDEIMGARPKFAEAGRVVPADHLEVQHLDLPVGHGHPAALVAMIMDGASLPALPADCDKLEHGSATNQVSRVMVSGEEEIRSKSLHVHTVIAHERQDVLAGKLLARNGGEAVSKVLDGNHAQEDNFPPVEMSNRPTLGKACRPIEFGSRAQQLSKKVDSPMLSPSLHSQ